MESKIYFHLKKVVEVVEGKESSLPVTCEVDPSNRCMLNCKFCLYSEYRSSENVDMDYSLYLKLLKELKVCGVSSITFTGGGEPLINPNINKMVEEAIEEGFEIGLVTNGVLLHTLKNINKFHFVRVSLDAATRNTYKTIKGKDLFEIVVKNVEELIVQKKSFSSFPTIGLSFVVCDENKHEIEQAQTLAKKIEVDYIQFKPVSLNSFNSCLGISGGTETIVTNRYSAKDTLPCLISTLIGVVGANGKCYFCCQKRGEKRFELGDLNEESFDEIWKKHNDLTPNPLECPSCRYMNYAKAYSELPSYIIKHRNFL